MRLDDLIIFVVVFGSMGAAIWVPDLGTVFHPCLLHLMMLLLFLSFLKMDFASLVVRSWTGLSRLAFLASIKLVLLPVILYWTTLALIPDFAIPVLLLTGMSTGVVAPFMGSLVGANIVTVLRMVMVTSLAVPFSLPALVKVLAGAEVTISLWEMMRMLALVIFLPMVLVTVLRRTAPGTLAKINKHQFPISMVLFSLVNLGVFSKYSSYFFSNPIQILVSAGVAYVLSVIYYLTGFAVAIRWEAAQRLAAGISIAIMNNVLVIVFSAEFFGPLSPTLAALYMFPYYTMIVPVKLMGQRMYTHSSSRAVGK